MFYGKIKLAAIGDEIIEERTRTGVIIAIKKIHYFIRKIQLLLYLQPIVKITKLHKALVKTYKYKWIAFTLFLKI